MAGEKKNLFYDFVTSGKRGAGGGAIDADEAARYITLNFVLLLGSAILIGYGVSVFLAGNSVRALLDLGMAGIGILTIVLLRTKLPFALPGTICIGAFGVLCANFVFSGDIRGFASLWLYAFPLMAIFALGLQIGLILSILLLCGILVATLIPGMAGISYSILMVTRLVGAYILVTVLTLVYEQVRLIKERNIHRLTGELKAERDEITAMKDNLKTGIFLMDKDYIIQPSYSKAMENILGTDEIQGKKFTDFLSSSIKAKERDTMVDYFDMVINRSFDAKMLEEINPISDFVYVNELNMEEKNLRTGFASVDRGLGVFMIQGTLEDITAQVKLQKELDAEAARRDEEMRSLFQVIKVDPRIFGDFIEDAEYEFNRINGILKNPEVSAAGAMGAIYQGVHAIKSNALILGLENFSVKLHELENKIKNIQDKSEISFDDALHITVELETIMREKDKYRDTIEKISAFKGGDSRRQDRYVLVETLTQACEKAAAAEEKKVKFIVEDLDGAVLENGPRRMMKEVLTQLIRNAVAHGIESPEEREAAGKTAEGQIRLSIKWADNQIHLKLSDDGRGLDFDRIRKKAESLNLFQSKDEVSDRNALLQVIFSPGFSTAGKATMIAGRGVGLDLVRDRVREHHGSIKLQTEKGKGTAFNLFIPMDASSAGKAAS